LPKGGGGGRVGGTLSHFLFNKEGEEDAPSLSKRGLGRVLLFSPFVKKIRVKFI